jgi:Skp family chaperone for outer membrane proteins
MKTRILAAVAAVASWSMTSCGPRATPEDCAGACRNFASLTKIVEGDRNQAVLEEIDREIRRLQDALERELEALDAEANRMLDLVDDDDERIALIEEYEARVEARQDEYQPRFVALEEARALGPGAADDEEALAGCIDRCLEERTGKHTTDCRANSIDPAEFHMCK